MRWCLTLSSLMLIYPAFAQENEAEKLYRAFEKKLVEAKAFSVNFDIKADKGKEFEGKGEVTIAAGNKVKLSFDGQAGPIALKALVVSDGKMVIAKTREGDKDEAKEGKTSETLNEAIVGFFTRAGLFFALRVSMPGQDEGKKPTDLKLSGFKLIGKEKIDNQDAVVIEYKLATPGDKETVMCKMWFDAKTNLPIQRQLEVENNGQVLEMRMTETYRQWQLEPMLPKDFFMLPK
jgi:outer membrane lipoprotein-sorting protein